MNSDQQIENVVKMAASRTNEEYYTEKYRGFLRSPLRAGWNFCALFFGLSWVLYRKMYPVLGWVLIITGLVSAASSAFFCSWVFWVFSVVLMLLLGRFGNLFLFKHLEKQLKEEYSKIDYDQYKYPLEKVFFYILSYLCLQILCVAVYDWEMGTFFGKGFMLIFEAFVEWYLFCAFQTLSLISVFFLLFCTGVYSCPFFLALVLSDEMGSGFQIAILGWLNLALGLLFVLWPWFKRRVRRV